MTKGKQLPSFLIASPINIAKDIYQSWRKGKDEIYTPWFWRFLMLVIKTIPEAIAKKISW